MEREKRQVLSPVCFVWVGKRKQEPDGDISLGVCIDCYPTYGTARKFRQSIGYRNAALKYIQIYTFVFLVLSF